MQAAEARSEAEGVVRAARYVIEKFGGRIAGSVGETRAQHFFADTLRAFSQAVTVEPFRVHPTAFMAFEPVLSALVLLAIGAFWAGSRWFAFALASGGLVVMALELGLYREFIDPLFPARTSHNVVARIRPPGGEAPRRRVVVGGHADAAYRWRFNRVHWLFLWSTHFVQIGSAVVVAATTVLPIFSHNDLAMGIVHALCGAFSLTSFFNTDWSKPVPGANDNLSGALAAISIGKHFAERVQLRQTELVILVSGSEEAGLRGAKAFAETHRAELLGSGLDTIFIELETLREPDMLSVAYKDLNGIVVQDERIVKLVQRAARSELGHDLKMQSVYCGATDAAALAEIGVASVAIDAMSSGPPLYYHTLKDNFDNMSAETIAAALQVCARAVAVFDEEGFPAYCLHPSAKPADYYDGTCSRPSPAATEDTALAAAAASKDPSTSVSPAFAESETLVIGTIVEETNV